MRSYYSHLESTAVKTDAIAPKPVLRSSAIFPAFQKEGITTRLLYMGYWFVKRSIASLTVITTLRNADGAMLAREVGTLKEAKAYRVELRDLLTLAARDPSEDFEGTIEIEFYALQNLFFPYPAVVVNYYGADFSTVVHTAQRVYNNYEDMAANSETKVPEAGFNIYANDDYAPFVTLINGPEACPNSHLYFECFNSGGHVMKETLLLGDLPPYCMKTLPLMELLPLKSFLGNRVGTMRISFDVRWVFPRLLVGNRQLRSPGLAITHSYYDCTRAGAKSDYWYAHSDDYYIASLMLPLCAKDQEQTKFYFYPIYSPSSFTVDLEIYDAKGKKLASLEHVLHVRSPGSTFEFLDAAAIARQLEISDHFPLNARLIARPDGDSLLPARIKLALDIGGDTTHLPCNICTNLQPYNPSWETKKHAFKWAPILSDRADCEVWIMNSSPKVNYTETAEMTLRFYREQDDTVIERHCAIPPFGSVVIRPHIDQELDAFFENKIGWLTVLSSNPYTTTYYFSRPQNGIVGGDHGF